MSSVFYTGFTKISLHDRDMKVISNYCIVSVGIFIFYKKGRESIRDLTTNVAVHNISCKIFIDISKFHDVKFFIQRFSTASRLDMQNDSKTSFWRTTNFRNLLIYVEPHIWLQ